MKKLAKSLKKKDYLNGGAVVKSGTKTTAAHWCIDALLEAVVLMCTVCPIIIVEASPCIYSFK